MKGFTLVLALFASSILFFALPSVAQQEDLFHLQTKEPLAIPGHVLSPGEYTLRMMDSSTYPGIVEVMKADGSKTYGFFQIIPARRDQLAGSQVVLNNPDSEGLVSVKQWFFPGDHSGYQFVYSRKDIQRQDQIARNMESTNARAGL